KKTKKIWMNGKLIPWEKANIHILTHGLHYGSGVFEGIRCYNTPKGAAVFRLKEHMKRLHDSAKIYRMEIPYTVEELCTATKKLIKSNKLKECYIRPIAYRGYGGMGLNPTSVPIDTAVACWSWGTYLGDDGLKNGIKAKISSYTRINPNTMPPRAKATGQYINSILAKLEALDCGYDEAILLDGRGLISEGPGENIFVIKDEVIYTPPLHASILPGITRDSVLDIAFDLGFDIAMTDIDRGLLYTADEAFFTGTAAELTPIREVDGVKIGKPGPITKRLQAAFFCAAKGQDPEYECWLDYV
ncbi:MAG: branched-chain amino acid transaminase, partial [Candidatus Altiarchaeota archaeon]|nr:branched-chain amino acid transaminase [Candidatus Altiarchaeota archaeon]